VGESWSWVRVVNLAVLACVFRTTTKKTVAKFLREESAPPVKILATPMAVA